MTTAEAIAWAKHCWGPKGIAGRSGKQFVVGTSEDYWTQKGSSFHSYEFAFEDAAKPVRMNHPAIQRAGMMERMERDEQRAAKPQQVEFC